MERSGVHPTTTPPCLQLRLQAQACSARLLRERLCLWLDELGASDEEIFDVSLACTEAFANAIEHPHQPTADTIDVAGKIANGTIAISVRDYGSWRQHRERAQGGYGFPLMRQRMDTVEVHSQPQGTTITMQRQLAPPHLG
jgi:anti-sigma regulatory factor (Ser/Thr protein kinase)